MGLGVWLVNKANKLGVWLVREAGVGVLVGGAGVLLSGVHWSVQ